MILLLPSLYPFPLLRLFIYRDTHTNTHTLQQQLKEEEEEEEEDSFV